MSEKWVSSGDSILPSLVLVGHTLQSISFSDSQPEWILEMNSRNYQLAPCYKSKVLLLREKCEAQVIKDEECSASSSMGGSIILG